LVTAGDHDGARAATFRVSERLHILVVGDEPLLREALSAAVENENDLHVVAAVGCRVPDAAAFPTPDVAVVHCGASAAMTTTLRSVRDRWPRAKVVVVGNGDDRVLAAALEGGATGYVTRDDRLVELLSSVRAAARGETVVPQGLLGSLLSQLRTRREHQGDVRRLLAHLTPREREILAELAAGADTAALTQTFGISRETARTHVQRLLTKLGVHSRLEAAALVTEADLVDELRWRTKPTADYEEGRACP
jgi:DNA-binding NarL/FixJ family response regulator